jgi:hypothetical protein
MATTFLVTTSTSTLNGEILDTPELPKDEDLHLTINVAQAGGVVNSTIYSTNEASS